MCQGLLEKADKVAGLDAKTANLVATSRGGGWRASMDAQGVQLCEKLCLSVGCCKGRSRGQRLHRQVRQFYWL